MKFLRFIKDDGVDFIYDIEKFDILSKHTGENQPWEVEVINGNGTQLIIEFKEEEHASKFYNEVLNLVPENDIDFSVSFHQNEWHFV